MNNCCRACFCCSKRGKAQARCPEEFVKQLMETTILTLGQIQHLYVRFCVLANYDPSSQDESPPKRLNKRHFFSLAGFSRNPLFSSILSSMFGERQVLTFVDFAKYLSLFQVHSLKTKQQQIDISKQKKYQLLFNLYDTDKDGRITQADLIKVVHKLFKDIMKSSHILNIVDTMLDEMDSSHTNQVLFVDFCTALAVFDMEQTLITNIPGA